MPELQQQFLQPKAIRIDLEAFFTLAELYLLVSYIPLFSDVTSMLKIQNCFVLKFESEITIVVS